MFNDEFPIRCAINLATTPDGVVAVTVAPNTHATAMLLPQLTAELEPCLEYMKQATIYRRSEQGVSSLQFDGLIDAAQILQRTRLRRSHCEVL